MLRIHRQDVHAIAASLVEDQLAAAHDTFLVRNCDVIAGPHRRDCRLQPSRPHNGR